MSFVKLGWGLGFVALGVLCVLAAIGVTAMIAPLVTVVALLVLVGGGNWLSGRSSPHARPRVVAAGPPSSRLPADAGPIGSAPAPEEESR